MYSIWKYIILKYYPETFSLALCNFAFSDADGTLSTLLYDDQGCVQLFKMGVPISGLDICTVPNNWGKTPGNVPINTWVCSKFHGHMWCLAETKRQQ